LTSNLDTVNVYRDMLDMLQWQLADAQAREQAARERERHAREREAVLLPMLQEYPEGLTPAEMRTLLGVDKSLADTCLGMLRYGLVQRVGHGRYVVVEGERHPQQGAP
jgi:hypothetical protein